MRTNKANEHYLVKTCLTELCNKAGFADPGQMVQRDQQFLCEHIQEKTGVLISLSTIKRLINGQFSHLPQIATLDAIAVAAGYQNWQDFKSVKNIGYGTVLHEDEKVVNHTSTKSRWSTRILLPVCVLIIVLILIDLFIIKKRGPQNTEKAHFSATKVTGNDIPNTVVFKYNVDSVTADSFFIQQSWDRNRRVKIDRNSHTLTDIYYEPGYHTAKLIANDQIIKTFPVSIPTDKWVFNTKEGSFIGNPKYIATTGIRNGMLCVTKDELVKSGADINKQNVISQLYFPSDIKYSSDNFIMRFRVKLDPLRNENCPFLMSEVFCQKNFLYFISTPKGCSSELVAQFGENFMNGKKNDLSMLGSNLSNWQNMEIRVQNKKVSIRINNAEVFTTSYHESCGLITGLGFTSNALCQVDFVDLETLDGKVIYGNGFGQ